MIARLLIAFVAALAVSTGARVHAAARAVVEGDLVQRDGDRLCTLSTSGRLSVVDVSRPDALVALGQVAVEGVPVEMYRRADFLVTLSNQVRASAGGGQGAAVVLRDLRDPARLPPVATAWIQGNAVDSRIVGDVLYVVTYAGSPALVTSFDLSIPGAIRQIDQIALESAQPVEFSRDWLSRWTPSVVVTDQRIYVGGYQSEANGTPRGSGPQGSIDVIDVTDAGGRLKRGAHLATPGPIFTRWQIDERDGVLRVVSQAGAGLELFQARGDLGALEVQTFQIQDSQSVTALGHLSLPWPRLEALRAARFDGPRLIASAYRLYLATDAQPRHQLAIVDLASPDRPVLQGTTSTSGFLFHLEPRGNRLLALGADNEDPQGNLQLTLLDVQDPFAPKVLARVAFGTAGFVKEFAIVRVQLPEDQNHIQRAFRVFDDGLVALPFTAMVPRSTVAAGCDNVGGGVQLLRWSGDALEAGPLLPLPGTPRRFLSGGGEVLALSDSNLRSYVVTPPNTAAPTRDLVTGMCVLPTTDGLFPPSSSVYDGCTTAPGRPRPPALPWAAGMAAVLVQLVRRRRR